jgi:hypothetical protein
MVPYIVKSQYHTQQPRKSRPRCGLPSSLFLSDSQPDNRKTLQRSLRSLTFFITSFLLPLRRTSIPVRVLDLSLCLPLLRKLPGVSPKFPFWNEFTPSETKEPLIARYCIKFFLFTFMRTFLHSAKTQLVCFHAIPHSLRKTRGSRGGITSLHSS